ncbi:hypothetical protein GALMADRAFT_65707 [Galerina marginata CBS 339.88]|uniref:Uncharacterized protein n=1 Tax=Galerina marginata (strain CBS 339.88) TaxID=685588 RepID=A0A067T3Z1_GALM3|nr:hypothetical protein GALMADRAFT_65707 [Galerina marginata CBS 339.88]
MVVRDVCTRWNYTQAMIERGLELRQASIMLCILLLSRKLIAFGSDNHRLLISGSSIQERWMR